MGAGGGSTCLSAQQASGPDQAGVTTGSCTSGLGTGWSFPGDHWPRLICCPTLSPSATCVSCRHQAPPRVPEWAPSALCCPCLVAPGSVAVLKQQEQASSAQAGTCTGQSLSPLLLGGQPRPLGKGVCGGVGVWAVSGLPGMSEAFGNDVGVPECVQAPESGHPPILYLSCTCLMRAWAPLNLPHPASPTTGARGGEGPAGRTPGPSRVTHSEHGARVLTGSAAPGQDGACVPASTGPRAKARLRSAEAECKLSRLGCRG